MANEDDVRRLALALPETTEKSSYGTPGFRVKDKLFLRIRSDEEGALVRLEAVDLDELGELIADAWRVRALKRLRDAFDRDETR